MTADRSECCISLKCIDKWSIIWILKFTQFRLNCKRFSGQLQLKKNNQILLAQTEGAEMRMVLLSARSFPPKYWDSICSTLKALQPNDMPLAALSLSPLPPLTTSVFLSPSKCLLWLGFFQHYRFHPSPPTYKTSFYHRTKAAMYFFVSSLFPRLAHVLAAGGQPLLQHSPHVPPFLLQTAIMCLTAA